ncbi:unnamed protein product, partial [Ectocarpus sp. 12 AP-2014]
ADAALLASAVAREGAVVHASWLGSVTLHEPIKVGVSSRLTILGESPGAMVTYSRPATGNADWRRPDAAGASDDEDYVRALFQVEKDA